MPGLMTRANGHPGAFVLAKALVLRDSVGAGLAGWSATARDSPPCMALENCGDRRLPGDCARGCALNRRFIEGPCNCARSNSA